MYQCRTVVECELDGGGVAVSGVKHAAVEGDEAVLRAGRAALEQSDLPDESLTLRQHTVLLTRCSAEGDNIGVNIASVTAC